MAILAGGKNILGIDLGSTSIKLVELKKDGKVPSLVTYGYLEKAAGDIDRGDQDSLQKKTIEDLKKLCQKSGATTNLAITALPNFSVFFSIITLPAMPEKELKEAVTAKAKKIIPLPIEDVILDWKILEKIKLSSDTQEGGKRGENFRILINVAAKKLVKSYLDIFKGANLQLVSLETESFALARALVGNDPSTAMIIDFSAVSTDIIVVDKTIPVFSRSIEVGGVALTRSLAENMHLSFSQAEQFKRDLKMAGSAEIPLVIKNTLHSIVEEIKYSINIFRTQHNKNVEKIILSGGSVYLNKLSDFFSQELQTKIVISNPWKRINYPNDLEPALLEVAPRFSVAIGLALR
jgi:type IV pilus assembly protein PilM